jgi:hypothetical protein
MSEITSNVATDKKIETYTANSPLKCYTVRVPEVLLKAMEAEAMDTGKSKQESITNALFNYYEPLGYLGKTIKVI